MKYTASKRLSNQKRRMLLKGKPKTKKLKYIGPDEHYGLADLLQDDITLEELNEKKKKCIDELKKTDKSRYLLFIRFF